MYNAFDKFETMFLGEQVQNETPALSSMECRSVGTVDVLVVGKSVEFSEIREQNLLGCIVRRSKGVIWSCRLIEQVKYVEWRLFRCLWALKGESSRGIEGRCI